MMYISHNNNATLIKRIPPGNDYLSRYKSKYDKVFALYRAFPSVGVSIFECYLEDLTNEQLRTNNLRKCPWYR